ncbi:hypothetical protein [Marinobacter sp.]|uniref:hypothetical protein n=1 Tax=Marinobacter sp. TaxID=50741 RepID=UPI003A8C9E65
MQQKRMTLIAIVLAVGAVGSGCSSTYKPPQVADTLIWTSDSEKERPMWTLTGEIEEDAGEQVIRFVGMSNRHSTQKGARDAAMDDARRQVANYATTEVEDVVTRMDKGGSLQSDIQDPMQKLERVTTQVSVHALSKMKPVDWRFEQWGDKKRGKTFFQAFVRTSVPESTFVVQENEIVSALEVE